MTTPAEEERSKKTTIAIIVIVVLMLSFIIPVKQWDCPITKGRSVSEATITQVGNGSITATINGTQTSLTMSGNIPGHAQKGQSIRIGYSKSGLYEDTSQKVEVSYYVDGNLLGYVTHMVFGGLRRASDDLKITNVRSDGKLLYYYRAA